ncbi:MAG: barstar family protein [Atopobiaceae bacterium]|nr:barstar family protein [Atopobiaceae bacterium]
MEYAFELELHEDLIPDRNALYAGFADALDLPEYYGKNLNALEDCLGDVCEPARIRVIRSRGEASRVCSILDKVCVMLLRAARENPALDVEISFAEPAKAWTEAYR